MWRMCYTGLMAQTVCVIVGAGRVLKIDRDMDIRHAEPADTCRLVRQGLFVGMEPEVDDVADAQVMDVCQLWFGRLAGCGYPVIEPTPIVDGFRVGHHPLVFGFGEWIPAGNAADRRGQFATDVEP